MRVLRDALKQVLPPFLLRAYRRVRPKALTSGNQVLEWEYLDPGSPESDERGMGWDNPLVAEIYARKWPGFLEGIRRPAPVAVNHERVEPGEPCVDTHHHYMTLAYVAAFASGGGGRLSVLDYGGALGQNLAALRELFPRLEVDYVCREMPSVCEQGGLLNPRARFLDVDSWTDGEFDLAIASNSLQYAWDWRAQLQRICLAVRSTLWVTRLPVVTSVASFRQRQRPHSYGYRTRFFGWALNEKEFLAAAQSAGFALERSFLVGRDEPFVHGAPEQPRHRGYLFRRG